MKHTIVIAWATKTALKANGRFIERDRNMFPDFDLAWEGHACVWLNHGTSEDEGKARKYIASDMDGRDAFLLLFDPKDSQCLHKARAEAVRRAEGGAR